LILREAMQNGVIVGIMAMAEQGDPSFAAKGLELMAKDDVTDTDEVLQQLVEALLAKPEQAPADPGNPGESAVQGAESLARGGIPGQADQAPPAAGLPPLAGILGQDSRQIS